MAGVLTGLCLYIQEFVGVVTVPHLEEANAIQKIQNKLARYLNSVHFKDKVSASTLKNINMLSINQMNILLGKNQFFECMYAAL